MASFAFTEEWISNRAREILPFLARNHRVYYISSGREKPPAAFAGTKMFKFPKYQLQNSLRIGLEARRLYRDGKIDFVVDYSFMCFFLRKMPYVEIVGGLYRSDFNLKWRSASLIGKLRLAVGFFHYCVPEMMAVKKAQKVVSDSRSNADRITEYFHVSEEKVEVIENGVSEEFLGLFERKSFLGNRILFVGSLHPRKGILPVLAAFSRQPSVSAIFTVCGDGPLREDIEKIAMQDNRIRFMGRVGKRELQDLYRGSDIFIFPSMAEGCSNALLEAMAAGHAIVTYDVKEISEVVGNAGLVAKSGDPRELIQRIKMLVEEDGLVEAMARKSHERAVQYTWKNCASRFDKLINEFDRKWGRRRAGR